MLYPLLFTPAIKDYLWGGRGLEKMGKVLPEGIVAESWEISGHPDGLGKVANGFLAGQTLPELMVKYGRSLVGSALPESALTSFPLLVKLIDANDRLSVQVHPDDDYAWEHENGSLGKTEMWVVLDAKPDAKLVYGLKPGVSRERFAQAVSENNIASCLNEISARKGDVFSIPAGLVHAIGSGLMMVEIQQNSNATYRVYDYNRTDASGNRRPLHISKAMDVICFSMMPDAGMAVVPIVNGQGAVQTILVANRYFVVERCEVDGTLCGNADGGRFELMIILEGRAQLQYPGGEIQVRMGDSLLLPANLGSYCIIGTCSALRTWCPEGSD